MDVTVVVATFGDRAWFDLAAERAVPSAEQHDVPVVHAHAGTLHDARNQGVAQVRTEWVCHLDADDELEPDYFRWMGDAHGDLRAPAVRYVRRVGQAAPAKIPGPVDLRDGNWLVIGTCVRTELVRAVGGWRDWPMYEDWDLWLRCWLAGAAPEPVPRAVYRAWVRADSRNRAPGQTAREQVSAAIAAANLGTAA